MIASSTLLLPQLAEYKGVSQNLVELANAYRQSGDEASAQAALQMATSLGQRLDGSGCSASFKVWWALLSNG
jgi:hypothetical protein